MEIKDNVLIKVEDKDIINGTVMIPNIITTIGDLAFIDCNSLEKIIIPDGVTNIGYEAFEWCGSLKK